jgi:hypothetical protein
MRRRTFRSFVEAREFAQSLQLRSKSEWANWASTPARPADIPADPSRIYRGEGWAGWGDWVGTGTVASFDRTFRPFEQARRLARSLLLHSKEEWAKWAKTADRPNDIPASPPRSYGTAWKGWGDWLGTGRTATFDRSYRPFDEARRHARALKLRSFEEWRQWVKTDSRPADIPAAPWRTYANAGWVNIKDWLGTVGLSKRPRRLYRSFEQARQLARSLQFTGKTQWAKWAASSERPRDIPAVPGNVYAEWINWGDWLGTGVVATFNRTYRPFSQARAFAHSLRLPGKEGWANWSKTANRPPDIPGAPDRVYAGAGWIGWGDWLGTGAVATVGRSYRPFEQARAFVHELRLQNETAWRVWSRSADRPADIPMTPGRVYADKWKGLGDWLGTRRVANQDKQFRLFDDARAFVRRLGLKSSKEWRAWVKTAARPADVPTSPDRVYAELGWVGWGDWLGTDAVATFNRTFLPFAEARLHVHRLKLTGKKQWTKWTKTDHRPNNIPTSPERAYKDEWKGWGDWLGTGTVATFKREYRAFGEARAFARRLGLIGKDHWRSWAKTAERPEDIPAAPNRVYRDLGWRDWGDWLGTGSTSTVNREYRTFENARAHVHLLRLRTSDEWRRWAKTEKRPADIPAAPWVVYREAGWNGINDWLGTDGTRRPRRVYRSFGNARAFARSLGLEGKEVWIAWARTESRPDDIPAAPDRAYASDGWNGWADWLGGVNAWTKTALVALLADLRKNLDVLEDRELYIILQQAGALPALRGVFGGASPMAVLREIREDGAERRIAEGTPADGAAESAPDLRTDEAIEEETLPELLSASVTEPGERAASAQLPVLATMESLHVVDALATLVCGLDDEAAEYLVSNRITALWERYISESDAVVEELREATGGKWFNEIRDRFLDQVDSVNRLPIPAGWAFVDDNGRPAPPLPMQRRTAWAVREKRRVGNWSGVGAGKTLSAVLTSRVVDAKCTIVICNNATVDLWQSQIRAAYPDSTVDTSVDGISTVAPHRHRYVVLNYEKFQTGARNHLVHGLLKLMPDFIVFDEVQFVKQRDENVSKRRAALEAFVSAAAAQNAELRVLGMSATPVINNLLEAKKLLEIVAGLRFDDLETVPTVNNALSVHRALMLNGFRYRPRYEIEMDVKVVSSTRNDLLDDLRAAGHDILSVEQALLRPKLHSVGDYFRPGTIVYTHYVDGIVPVIRDYIEQLGLRVGLYYGSDKSGLEPFKQRKLDVLIGSSSIGTGVDGLQKVADRLVMLCLPWTGAEYEQIIGRIRRQRSAFRRVEIIVPQIVLDAAGSSWSWDRGRMACIQFKRTLSDCALDGLMPEAVRISPSELLRRSREALDTWIERVQRDGLLTVARSELKIPLPPDVLEKTKRRLGDFSTLNQRWNSSRSDTVHERLTRDPSEWYLYHTELRSIRARWPEDPCRRIADRLRIRPDWVIGDFGCGEGLLGKQLSNKVIGIDHVGVDDSVIVADMAKTPLPAGTLDVVVFSLSLMSTNWRAYLSEAHRTLRPFGQLLVAEPRGRWEGRIQELIDELGRAGFRIVGEVEQRYDFYYLEAVRHG